ncbi:hypothetical protein HMPREF9440_02524 [Sutterella parvirubra YIT 11816]|uniref:Uncharacterized protein n=1 Tax=Sutterella parvirubra YIT 11816 TaxID=762967 RepID=H3KIB5_9BURK|nr:hypothetical protein HMPREF9440_02524 [Sutterella parvirubra YIT 11816]
MASMADPAKRESALKDTLDSLMFLVWPRRERLKRVRGDGFDQR